MGTDMVRFNDIPDPDGNGSGGNVTTGGGQRPYDISPLAFKVWAVAAIILTLICLVFSEVWRRWEHHENKKREKMDREQSGNSTPPPSSTPKNGSVAWLAKVSEWLQDFKLFAGKRSASLKMPNSPPAHSHLPTMSNGQQTQRDPTTPLTGHFTHHTQSTIINSPSSAMDPLFPTKSNNSPKSDHYDYGDGSPV